MNEKRKHLVRLDARRRFLALLGGASTCGLALPFLPRWRQPRELSLKEAEFYRRHDLAG